MQTIIGAPIKPPLSKPDRLRVSVCVTLGVLLLLALMLAGGGYVAERQELGKAAAFASNGAVASGRVTGRSTEVMTGSAFFYDLDVTFTPPDAPPLKQTFRVPRPVLDAHQIGSRIQLTYVKSHPAWFYVTGAGPDPRDLDFLGELQLAGCIGAAVLALAFAASIWLARNVGKVEPPTRPWAPPVRPTIGRTPGETFGGRDLRS
jgi:hypothetical protein